MSGILRNSLFFFILIYAAPMPSATAETIILDSDAQYRYARQNYDNGDYIVSIVEFKKFLSFFQDDPKARDAEFHIAMSWYKGRKYRDAIKVFSDITQRDLQDQPDLRNEAYFMIAKSHIASGNPVMAEITLANFIKITSNIDTIDRAVNLLAWIRLETSKWDKARRSFGAVSLENKEKYQVDDILSRLSKISDIPTKSPAIAGTLAVIPGAGYLYCNRYQDAFVSCLLNSALIYAAYEAFDHDQNALGGVITFIGFGFYSGSIYGSTASAHKYNRNARQTFIRKIKKDIPSGIQLGVMPDFKRKGLSLGMQMKF